MSWFRGSGGSSMSSSANAKVPFKEGIKALQPAATNLARPDRPPERSRFSQLLLEHGERQLQDWAVIASSNVISTPPETQSSAVPSPKKRSSNGGKTLWAQASFSAGSSRKQSKPPPPKSQSFDDSIVDLKSLSPSANMGKIEGRLHLCSSSVVFEPNDITRAVVRCPFARMEFSPTVCPPEELSSFDSSFKTPVVFQCKRHIIMKANNVIGPFRTMEMRVRFRFTFLHSSPDKFIDFSQKLFNLIQGDGGRHKGGILTPEVDAIMKPMLDRPFDPSNLADVRERPLTSNLRCSLLTPLQSKPGCAIVTSERIYFQPASGVLSPTVTKASSWLLIDILATARRYSGLRDSAMEFYWKSGSSVLMAFESQREREQVMRLLPLNAICFTDRSFVVEAGREWHKGSISNYDYLLALNSAAGRSFHDLSRYPVFPWVVADYQSSSLDLRNEATFRDLSKPVGALNEERLEYFRTRLKGMMDMEEPFLYGTHYSAPGYVLYYLVRSMPEHMLCLQNGKFDSPDRMFHCMQHCFSCVLSNHADVKELIPEFYNTDGGFDFLINARSLQLGATQNGERVHDVGLPPWAKSPRDFLKKNRKALESDICTRMLPQWIDLIFGHKSRGEQAREASNLFHKMAYLGPADLDALENDDDRYQAELQATEFGIVPDLLFRGPHPSRQDTFDSDDFVASEPERGAHLEIENDSGKGDQHAWEFLDPPSQISAEEIKTHGHSDSRDNASDMGTSGGHPSSVGNVLLGPTMPTSSGPRKNFPGTLTTANTGADGVNPLATPGGKAKASWGSNLSSMSDVEDSGVRNGAKSDSKVHRTAAQKDFAMSHKTKDRKLPLRGSGDGRTEGFYDGVSWSQSFSSSGSHDANEHGVSTGVASSTSVSIATSSKSWDMKVLARSSMHGDSVTGCALTFEQGIPNQAYLTTVSLDGRLMIHTVSLGSSGSNSLDSTRRSFTGTLSRFTNMGISRDQTEAKLHSHRSHSASDPLACLALTGDDHGGLVVFAGGHDDCLLAYGVNSACAVASVYSHRDAVTGLDLIHRSPSGTASAFWPEKATHLMVSGSWDATVKVWSVVVSPGETVSINREPLAELFDADSTIVCVASTSIPGGIGVCAGCADGSFVAWILHDDGKIEVIYKESSRRGSKPCSAVKWATENGETALYTAFATGKVASYTLINRELRSVSAVSLGVAVTCLKYSEGILLAGCADGGLRLISVQRGAQFDSKPTLWNAVNGQSAPGLTSINVEFYNDTKEGIGRCLCSSGADDGSVALFELKKV